ncbi:MAG: hypothetical protein WA055_02020 [Candidatus Moraniibacteriota bacterium]
MSQTALNLKMATTRRFVLYQRQGVYLHLVGEIDKSEIIKIKKRWKNYVILSTCFHPMGFPRLLGLDKPKILEEGFAIRVNRVGKKIWKNKNSK